MKRRYFQDGGYNPTLVFDTLARLMDDTPTDAFVDRLEAEWYEELEAGMGSPVTVSSAGKPWQECIGTDTFGDGFIINEGSDLHMLLTEIEANGIPHNFESIYEYVLDQTGRDEDSAYDLAFTACEKLGVGESSVNPMFTSNGNDLNPKFLDDMFGKEDPIFEGINLRDRLPIQQDLKGLISMVKGWLQRLHEGLMERSVFYHNLMVLLKGNGYPGSKANSIYEELMAGQPVEAVLASVKRVRSFVYPILSAKTKVQAKMIQEHILTCFDSYEDLLSEIQSNYDSGGMSGLRKMVEGGAFAAYYDDARVFLNSLYNTPKSEEYDDDRVWNRYVSLLSMELYNILKNPSGGGHNYIALKSSSGSLETESAIEDFTQPTV